MVAIANINLSPVRLTYGAHDLIASIGGLSVAEARFAYSDILNVSEGVEAYLNGALVNDWHTPLIGGDRLEFMRSWGWKGSGHVTRQEVWHGDCLELMSSLAEASVNIVATSPPYNIGVRYDGYNDLRPDAEYRGWLDRVFRQVTRVLSDVGSFFLVVGSTPRMPRRATDIADIAARRFRRQNRIIWVKSLAINDRTLGHYQPINSERFLHHNYEEVFHFTQSGSVPLDRNAIGVPYTESRALVRWKRAVEGLHCRGDVWFVPYPTVRGQKAHPATFPPKLIEMCIRLHGFNRDTFFLDPFAGIGNSLLACQRLGVRGVGMEVSEKYVAEARRRLQEARK